MKINGHEVIVVTANPRQDEVYPAYKQGAQVRDIAKAEGADFAINFNYANTSIGLPIGRLIVGGKTVVSDMPKTTPREELYMLPDGTLRIGKATAQTVWAVQGSPVLRRNGKNVIKETIDRDQLGDDIWTRNSIRTAAGIRSDGSLVLVKTLSAISLEDLGKIFDELGCPNALNGDGGGSSYIWPENQGAGRLLGSALCIKRGGRSVKEVTFGIDCANPLTGATAKAVAAAGAKFAVRYLVPASYAWKRLTRLEADAILAAGMKIASVFQKGAKGPAGGKSAGQADGREALAEAKLIGQPVGSAIFFAVDYDAGAKDYDAIEAYLRAAQAELPGYHVGVYGNYGVIEAMSYRKACRFFWQTYAWSGGKRSAAAHLYQYKNDTKLANVSVDFNDAYSTEIFWGDVKEEPVMSKTFKDVPAGHYAAASIEKAAVSGVLAGVSEGVFGLGQTVTREQLAVVLDRLGLLDKK